MMSAMLRSLLALLACIALVGGARPAAARDRAGDERMREAREHYEKGLLHYNLGEFAPAIAEFKTAYELSRAPRLLFNIALAQRLNKDFDGALYSYTTHLRLLPDADNRVDVAARIAEMSRVLRE